MKPLARAVYYEADQRLTKKALSLSKGRPTALSDDDLEKLEAVIDNAKDGFTQDVTARLRNLRQAIKDMKQDPERRGQAAVDDIKTAAYELKGMGGMFGFPNLTQVAAMLHDYVDSKTELSARQVEVVAIHMDLLYVIVARNVTQIDPGFENELTHALALLVARWP